MFIADTSSFDWFVAIECVGYVECVVLSTWRQQTLQHKKKFFNVITIAHATITTHIYTV